MNKYVFNSSSYLEFCPISDCLKQLINNEYPVFICLGSALAAGDDLGPKIGYNLDLKLKSQIMQDIKKSKQKTPKTIVFVTHDIFEAINLSDRIIVIKQGEIIEDINDLTKNQDLYQKIFDIMTN